MKIYNEGLDSIVDPLFNVTHLVLWMEDKPNNRLKLQHWQWDWRNFIDFDWPFRLLLRLKLYNKCLKNTNILLSLDMFLRILD